MQQRTISPPDRTTAAEHPAAGKGESDCLSDDVPPITVEDGTLAHFRDIVAAPDIECLREAVLAAARAFGFAAVFYLSPVTRDGSVGRLLTNQGFPAAWERQYRRHFRRIDPLPEYAMDRLHVFRWGSVLNAIALTPEQERYREFLHEVGMADGLAVAVWGPGGRCGYIAFGMAFRERAFAAPTYIGVGVTAQLSFNRYCSLLENGAAGEMRLSPREIEILHWAARGKSNPDIAAILGIARGTVDTYMRRVFQKFGTNDRTVACIRAHELGFIHASAVPALDPARY